MPDKSELREYGMKLLRDNRFATLRAQAAVKGYALYTDPHGGYWVAWRGVTRPFETLEEFEGWLAKVTGRAG